MNYFWIFLIYGIALSVVLAFVSFLDLLSVLMKAIPNNKIEGYEEYKRLKDSVEYKKHRRKWLKKIALVSAIAYAVTYIVITVLTTNIAIGFCVSLFLGLLCAGRLKGKETQERKSIENEINTGDGFE